MRKIRLPKWLMPALLAVLTAAALLIILSPPRAPRPGSEFQLSPLPSPRPDTVWVSSSGGTKYHLNPDCSGMSGAVELSLDEAIAQGFTPCKKCG